MHEWEFEEWSDIGGLKFQIQRMEADWFPEENDWPRVMMSELTLTA